MQNEHFFAFWAPEMQNGHLFALWAHLDPFGSPRPPPPPRARPGGGAGGGGGGGGGGAEARVGGAASGAAGKAQAAEWIWSQRAPRPVFLFTPIPAGGLLVSL